MSKLLFNPQRFSNQLVVKKSKHVFELLQHDKQMVIQNLFGIDACETHLWGTVKVSQSLSMLK